MDLGNRDEGVHVERHPQFGDPGEDRPVHGVVEEPIAGPAEDQHSAHAESADGPVQFGDGVGRVLPGQGRELV